MKSKMDLKKELAEVVAEKKALTAARRAIKAVPYATRGPSAHNDMLRLGATASYTKEAVRTRQLAYVFVRGLQYWQQERFAREPVDVCGVAATAEVDVAVIEAWVRAPISAEARTAYEEHLLRCRQVEGERRQRLREMRRAA